MAFTTTFLVSNLHCPSCVSYAHDVLRDVADVQSVQVSLIEHTIRVRHARDSTREVTLHELTKAAFDIHHVTTVDVAGGQTHDYDVPSGSHIPAESRFWWRMSRAQRKHIENCQACQKERDRISTRRKERILTALKPPTRHGSARSRPAKPDNSDTTLVDDRPAVIHVDGPTESEHARRDTAAATVTATPSAQSQLYRATLSVGGMTCASCTGAITRALDSLDVVVSADVTLMTNSASVVLQGPKANTEKVVETIEDLGYDASLEQVVPIEGADASPTGDCKVVVSIEGMTCGSCAGAITRGLQDLPFVRAVSIDLLGNSGTITCQGRHHIDEIKEKIDDLGYESTVVEIVSLGSPPRHEERTVQIKIDGMFCEHCPETVAAAVRTALPSSYRVIQWPTLKDPILTVAYLPVPPEFTVRTFIAAIDDAHEAFSAAVYQPPSIEERSRQMHHKEQRRILSRLVFTGIVAIPTFIIGVVYMSLVPSSNPTRQWFQAPIIAGDAMRMEWALFFMTTPVMIFGTDLFHVRAFKELYAMWRPKSKVPLLRRFYRFGSMNLLISAGSAVAYFSSVAVLIMDATSDPSSMDRGRASDTYFDTVTFLTFFILIGRFLESYSKAKTGDAVAMLSKLRPSEASLVVGDRDNGDGAQLRQVPVNQLEVGDTVQIPHGSSPPADGSIVQHGSFLFDESSLTGESKPVPKAPGDPVYTGSVNSSDPVRITVTDLGGTSMLDRIVNVVREGQAKRAPIERIADLLTGYFVPVISLMAVLTWVIWLSLGETGRLPAAWLDVSQGGWAFWSLEFAIAVFVVACPCGLGLAAPTALFVGGGLAAKHGILVQGGGQAFQEASNLDVIVFDKTGTLTEGRMRVTDFEMLPRGSSTNLLPDEATICAMSRSLEATSTHPIAKAITDFCAGQPSDVNIRPFDVKEIPGHGLTGKFVLEVNATMGEYEVALGNERFIHSLCVSAPPAMTSPTEKLFFVSDNFYLASNLQKHQSLGHSTAIVAVRKLTEDSKKQAPFVAVGLFAIADPVRGEAFEVLQSLRDAHLDVHLCTGDNPTTAAAVASKLGIPISNVRAGVLPQNKAAYIRDLQGLSDVAGSRTGRRIVAFVGDGTNDTPALSAADVSIALSSGSDVAVTTASFILLNSDLRTILSLVRLAKRVFLRVKLNFAWAAAYNLCLVPVAAGVFFPVGANAEHGGWRLGPVWASVAMAASSVSVVLSSLALKLPELTFRH